MISRRHDGVERSEGGDDQCVNNESDRCGDGRGPVGEKHRRRTAGRIVRSVTVALVLLVALALYKSTRASTKELSPAAKNDSSNRAKFATQDHVSTVTFLGTKYGGWAFDEKLAGPSPVVYSFGLGEDISWDAAMIEKYNVRLFGFDPTPKVRETKVYMLNWLRPDCDQKQQINLTA